VRSLVLAQDFPWPMTSGSFLRLDAVVRALGQLGDVELFATVLDIRDVPCTLPDDVPVTRWTTATFPRPDYSARRRSRWLAGRLPLEVAAQQLEGPRRELARWARPPYDFVWCSKAPTYVGLGRPAYGPTVVDLDDLEDRKILARIDSGALRQGRQATAKGRLHAGLAAAQARLNAGRWQRLQRSIAREVGGVAVCSDLDAQRLGVPGTLIVPNGFDTPTQPAGHTEVRSPPTVLFQGVLFYGPNADAVRWLVGSIGPRLRQLVPDVQIRLVGAPDTPIRRLDDPPRVQVVGRVPDMRPELQRADVAVVPIRFGSGTRVKALEAFANRIPVVSTTLGVEGLDALDGHHLLVADSAEQFAEACARLLSDVDLRTRLTEAAFELVATRHRWERAQAAVIGAAGDLGAGRKTAGTPA
jgi:glycosyltransferase involved in cell wall biosynthesis